MSRIFSMFFFLLLSTTLVASPSTEIAQQVSPALRNLYEARQFSPLWLDGNKPSARATQAIEILSHADDDALHVGDYAVNALQHSAQTLQQQPGSDQQLATFDLSLSQHFAQYVRDLSVGRIDPRAIGMSIDTTAQQAALPQQVQTVLTATDLDSAIAAVRPAAPHYTQLRRLLVEYRILAKQYPSAPALPPLPKKKLNPGEQWSGTPALANWLILLGDHTPDASAPTTEHYTGAIVEGVKHFQRQHGQIPDGVIGKQTYDNLMVSLPTRVKQIELAMERLRWLDRNLFLQRFIIINVPQFTLWGYAQESGTAKPVLQMPVVVGKAGKNATPLMVKNLSAVVFNPYWNVPRSITTKEIMPKLAVNPLYLAHEDMELVDGRGISQGSAVGEAEYVGLVHGAYRIRQRPGRQNALGELKFVFPNDDSIYMHDTPSKSFFNRERRDLSHGCVRLGNPMAMALYALTSQGEWDEARVRAKLATGGRDQHLALSERIPVLLLYLTANVDDQGKAVFLQDIYGQDAKLIAALATARKSYQ